MINQEEIKKHNENGMNYLKEMNFIDAYKSFYEALIIYEAEMMTEPQNEDDKVQYLNFSQMASTMLMLEFKKNNNQEFLYKAIEILKKSVNI